MRSTRLRVLVPATALLSTMLAHSARAQTAPTSTPTTADFVALAKLPDVTGVWEISMGGGGRGRGVPQGPSLTPAAAAKRKQLQSLGREDNQTANCLPPGMPGIMGQPYWGIEGMSPNYLGRRGWTKNSLKPGDKVSIVIRPMRDGSPGGMFVRATLADGRELRQTGQAVD